MALIDRFVPATEEDNQLPAHEFMGGLYMWASGTWTRADVISKFGLLTADEAQLDTLASTYTGLSTKADKLEFLLKLEQGVVLLQGGMMTKAELQTFLGL